MRVLVTGGFGYFGLALVRRLAREHDVVAVGRDPRRGTLDAVLAAMPTSVSTRGMCDVRGLTAVGLRDIEAVVHLAGGGAPGGLVEHPTEAIRDNVDSAIHVVHAARNAKRLLLASSIYVYGSIERPARESDGTAPDTLYGAMKRLAEAVWHEAGGTALRFSHLYGVGSGVDFRRDGVSERMARAAVGLGAFSLHGDGSQRLDLVHIDDACEAVARALVAPELPPAINIGGGSGAPSITRRVGKPSKASGTR